MSLKKVCIWSRRCNFPRYGRLFFPVGFGGKINVMAVKFDLAAYDK